MDTTQVGFGGGCHWCTEAVFQAVPGVERVEQGFVRSVPPDDAFSEAVLVGFDPDRTGLAQLIDIHLRSHASTSEHAMRAKYRSAIYVFSPEQGEQALKALAEIQANMSTSLVTRVLPFEEFRPSEDRYQNYFRSRPGHPFCQRYIVPKLKKLNLG